MFNKSALCQFDQVLDEKRISVFVRSRLILQLLESHEALSELEKAFLEFYHFPAKINLVYKELKKQKKEENADSPYKDLYEKTHAIFGGRFRQG